VLERPAIDRIMGSASRQRAPGTGDAPRLAAASRPSESD
jgi:hypothetical protein